MHAAWWMLGALAVLAIAYRYYSAFIAARVLCLDDARATPAHTLEDGINFHPTACTALCVATTILLREAKRKVYALITLAPLLFVGTTTITAGVESVRLLFLPMLRAKATYTTGLVNVVVTSLLLFCAILVLVGSAVRWWGIARAPRASGVLVP